MDDPPTKKALAQHAELLQDSSRSGVLDVAKRLWQRLLGGQRLRMAAYVAGTGLHGRGGRRSSCMLPAIPGVARRVISCWTTDLVPSRCQTWPVHRVPSVRPVTR